ncbi:recombinase family protein (plasmid) [Fusobacterium animalis]|uniref:recombinase family protein n=1 Tax=Fusobacterium animalis TaxID=76859 RepID=UPI0030D12167
MNNMLYGYARVSRDIQDLTRQLKELEKTGVSQENIFKDIATGRNFTRLEYQRLVNKTIKAGDTIIITSLDRLGRSMELIEEEYNLITNIRGCKLISLEEPFLNGTGNEDIDKFIQPLFLKIFAWLAERERKELLKRQKQAYNSMEKDYKGRLISNRTGKALGRTPTYSTLSKDQLEIIKEWIDGKRTASSVARLLKISRTTLYKIKDEYL